MWVADVIARGKVFIFLLHEVSSHTCIFKCQTPSGVGSLTWRCPFQKLPVVQEFQGLGRALSSEAMAAQKSAFVMTWGCLPYAVTRGLGSFFQEFSRIVFQCPWSKERHLVLLWETHKRVTFWSTIWKWGKPWGRRHGFTHLRGKARENSARIPNQNWMVQKTHRRTVLKCWTEISVISINSSVWFL